MCFATSSEYGLIDLATGQGTPVGLPISQSTTIGSARTRPSIAAIPAQVDQPPCFLITSHSESGTLGAFLQWDGEPTAQLIEWPSHPRTVVVSYPYVCALLRDDVIHIHQAPTWRHVQTIPVDASLAPRFLCTVAPVSSLLPSRPGLPTQPVPVGDGPFKHLPPSSCAAWAPVSVLFAGKQAVYALSLHTPGSQVLLLAHAEQWREAAQCLSLPTLTTDEERAAALLVGWHHLSQARFTAAVPWLLHGHLDVRCLLAMDPASRTSTSHALVPACLAGVWRTLPSSWDALLDANLRRNYVPDLAMDDDVLVTLRHRLAQRAMAMVDAVLAAAPPSDPAVSTAYMTRALFRDACAPVDSFTAYLSACDCEQIAPLCRAYRRYALLARACEAQGHLTKAMSITQDVIDGHLSDPVDTLTLDDVVRMAPGMPADQRVNVGVWLTKHAPQRGLEVCQLSTHLSTS
ncbi:autophagy protein [Malassezia pachydermatis]